MDASILLVTAALAIGLIVGYVLGGRPAAALRGECDALRQRCGQADIEVATHQERSRDADAVRALRIEVTRERDEALNKLAALQPVAERVGELEAELVTLRTQKESLASAKAAFERGEEERQKAHDQQLGQIKELEAKMSARFGELANNAVRGAHDEFLKRADERFGHAGKQSEEKLRALLQPVETTLKRYEEGLTRVEKEREGSYGELKQAVAQLSQGNEVVRRETSRLANVMRSSPKARGRWGEEQLRTILEAAGLAENVDFSLQTSVRDGERQLRPDCVINLPGGRCMVVDVKCPLVHFEAAFDEEDEEKRASLLLQHANAMGTYATDLGRKSYWRQFDLSPDFVIMFVPGEHFLSAAAERAPDLIETAFRQGVILASTINMLALAKLMAGMWRQESLAARANEVAEAGKEVYASLRVLGGHVRLVGENLERASLNYNKLVGTLEGGLYRGAKRLEDLKVDTGGQLLGDVKRVEAAVRPLTKLETAISSED